MPPKKKTLSQDQLEVYAACFGESPPGSPTSGLASQGVIEKDLYIMPDGQTVDLTDTIQRAVNKRMLSHVSNPSDFSEASLVGLSHQGNSNPSLVGLPEQSAVNQQPPQYDLSEDSDSEQSSVDESEGDDSDIADVLGVGVNSQAHKASKIIFSNTIPQKGGINTPSSIDPPHSNKINSNESINSNPSDPPPVAKVDPNLPSAKKKKVSNMTVPLEVADWARENFNHIDPGEQIKIIEENYIHDPSLEDLFSPIRSSKHILKEMNSAANKSEDTTYFDRSACEKHLYKASKLISLSYKPFLEAISQLTNIPSASAARNIVGQGLLAISAASHEISFARRELCRKMVRADVFPYLFSNQPTINQLFGGDSIEAQVAQAKVASKNNFDFIHKRKPKAKTPYQKTGFQKGKNQKNQQAGNQSRQGQGRFQRRKGNGKGKQTKTQNDSLATSTNTNN